MTNAADEHDESAASATSTVSAASAGDRPRPARRAGLGVAALVAFASLGYAHRALLASGPAGGDASTAVDRALYDPSFTAPVLGLAVFVLLVFRRRAVLREAITAGPGPSRLAAGLGALALAVGFALVAWSRAIDGPDLLVLALILETFGAAAWLGGRRAAALVAYPALALVCVVAMPAVVLNALVFPLQLATVALTSGLLSLFGRAHLVAGDLILTHGVAFQVIEGCSGLKTILSLLLAAVAYLDLVGRRGREKALLFALVPAIGFVANGLRVLLLVFREIPAESAEHQAYGIAAVVLGVGLLSAVELALARTLFHRWAGASIASGSPIGDPVGHARDGAPGGRAHAGRALPLRAQALAVASVALPLLLARIPVGSWGPPPLRLPNIEALPDELLGCTARGLRVDDAFLGHVHFAHRIYRAYEREGRVCARVFVGLADPERRDASARSPKTAIPHSGWLALERGPYAASPGLERERLTLRYDPRQTGDRSLDTASMEPAEAEGDAAAVAGDGASAIPHEGSRVLVEHLRSGFAPWEAELVRSAFGLDRLFAPSPRAGLVLRVEIDATDDPEADELRIRQVTEVVLEWAENAG